MRDFTSDLREIARRLAEAHEYLHIDQTIARVSELEIEVSRPDLWDDQNKAKQINAEYSALRADIDTYQSLRNEIEDLEVLHELAREVDDETQEVEIATGVAKVIND